MPRLPETPQKISSLRGQCKSGRGDAGLALADALPSFLHPPLHGFVGSRPNASVIVTSPSRFISMVEKQGACVHLSAAAMSGEMVSRCETGVGTYTHTLRSKAGGCSTCVNWLMIAGAPEDIALPESVRAVDVAPLCLKLLGLTPRREVGASHVMT